MRVNLKKIVALRPCKDRLDAYAYAADAGNSEETEIKILIKHLKGL